MSSKGIGMSNLPNLKYGRICRKGIDFNIMIVGSTGLGKTSFINGLFNINLLDTTTEKSDFHVSTCTIVENQFKTNIIITEINNIGDRKNNDNCWRPIIKYVHDSYTDFWNKEQENVRDLISDKRVHLCFYFLEPNIDFIRPADLLTMKEISKYCNLVPVVSKSDLLNENEKQEAFDFLRNIFEENNILLFEEEKPERGKLSNFTPPFFIISPDDISEHTRKYPWGVLDIRNFVTNDLYRLRDQLINKNIIELIRRTEDFYDMFRATLLYEYVDTQASKELNKELKLFGLSEEIEDEYKMIKEMKARILEKKEVLNITKE
ncbi:septin [Vairimorpha necatrix]|uniref:Septin n=1 Tax=Vairimorpha necatrix TaxID=6039 RepID=A0AAX4J9Z8_9MICR